MPYPQDHFLLAFGGPLYTTEEWSCSLRSTVDTQSPDDISTVVMPAVAAALKTWWQGGTNPSGSQAKLAWCKYNRINAEGKYVSNSTNLVDYSPVGTTAEASTHPAQISIVATLETGATRGLAHRGRIFLPVPKYGVSTDGRITSAFAQATATGVAGLIAALNAVPGYGTTSIISNTREGAIRTVTGVSAGRTLDTMRSRRTSIPEERAAVVPVGGT